MPRSEDKNRGRPNVISHLLAHIPDEPVPAEQVELPERSAAATPPPPDSFQPVPELF